LIAQTAEEFVPNEATPLIADLQAHEEGVMVGLMGKAGELGLLGYSVPEAYGGSDLDKISTTVPHEQIAEAAIEASRYPF
jgi:alkylation response protein AidB-like acyl-CoA dehydrogenase